MCERDERFMAGQTEAKKKSGMLHDVYVQRETRTDHLLTMRDGFYDLVSKVSPSANPERLRVAVDRMSLTEIDKRVERIQKHLEGIK